MSNEVPDWSKVDKTQRERAIKILSGKLGSLLTDAGYTKEKLVWKKTNFFALTALGIQRSTYGFAFYLNISAKRRFGFGDGKQGFFASTSVHRIQSFVDAERRAKGFDQFHYTEIDKNPALISEIGDVITTGVIPWMNFCHTFVGALSLPKPGDYLK